MSQAIVIHSDPQALKTLGSYLSKRGIEVVAITDPASLYTIIDEKEGFSPVLAVIDLHLPDDGWLLGYQKVLRRFSGIRTLFLTNRSDPNLMMRAKVHGAKHFMRPPFTEEALLHSLRRMARLDRAE